MPETKMFIPIIGEIFINGEILGSVTQAANQTETEFKKEVFAAAAILREAYKEIRQVNYQLVYRFDWERGTDNGE